MGEEPTWLLREWVEESDLFILSTHLLVAVAKCHGYHDGMK